MPDENVHPQSESWEQDKSQEVEEITDQDLEQVSGGAANASPNAANWWLKVENFAKLEVDGTSPNKI